MLTESESTSFAAFVSCTPRAVETMSSLVAVIDPEEVCVRAGPETAGVPTVRETGPAAIVSITSSLASRYVTDPDPFRTESVLTLLVPFANAMVPPTPVMSSDVAWSTAPDPWASGPLTASVTGPLTDTLPRVGALVDRMTGPPAETASSEPATDVTLAALAALTPLVAERETGPPVVWRRPLDWMVIPPLVAATVIERPDPPAITGSVITTSGAVIVMSPLTVVAPVTVMGWAYGPSTSGPAAVRLAPTAVYVPTSEGADLAYHTSDWELIAAGGSCEIVPLLASSVTRSPGAAILALMAIPPATDFSDTSPSPAWTVPVETPGETTLNVLEFTKETVPLPLTIDTFVTVLDGDVSVTAPAVFVTARFFAVMLPVGCVIPVAAESVTFCPAA